MCGISGLINFNGLDPDYRMKLALMTSALKHRGPDYQDEFMDESVGLGHRRLSIIDLSLTANQPMFTKEKDVVIVFNGEVYNHAEIRKELEGKYPFQTNHSDTEVILYAYKEWGISEAVKRFTGMFAFALYDIPRKTVYLVRDRIGQKPINFAFNGETMVFASEVHAMHKANLIPLDISTDSIYHYLTFLTAPPGESMYGNVQRVKAGHIMEITPNGRKEYPYWNITDYLNTHIQDDEATAIERTEALLEQSMRYRNIADVPVSLAMSGGLDSSLNLYYSSKINPDLRGINVSFSKQSEFNEEDVAKRYCKEMGVPLSIARIDEATLMHEVRKYMYAQSDVPTGDPNAVLMYYISRRSEDQDRKVMLVGEGGDEIGGYPKYLKHFSRYKLYSKAPMAFKLMMRQPIYNLRKLDVFHGNHIVSQAHVHGFTEAEKRKIWQGHGPTNSYDVLWDIMKEVDIKTNDQFLRQILNLEYKLRLPEMILQRIDYPTTAASIEARSPFVDHKLIEYSAGLPFDLKMKNGQAKYIIRKIAEQKLPDYIMNQKKVGFGQLLTPFLNTTLPAWFDTDVLGMKGPVLEYLKPTVLENMLRQHRLHHNIGFKMWVIFALNTWLDKLVNADKYKIER